MYPHWFQCGSGPEVSITKNWTNLQLNFFLYFWSNIAKLFILRPHKGCPAKGEVFVPQKITSTWSTWNFFSFLGPFRWFLPSWIRIRIQPRPKWMRIHANPNPQHWNLHSFTTDPDPEQLTSPHTYLLNLSSGIRSPQKIRVICCAGLWVTSKIIIIFFFSGTNGQILKTHTRSPESESSRENVARPNYFIGWLVPYCTGSMS